MLIKSHHNITSGQLKLRIYLILFVPLIFAQCIFSFMLYEPLRTAKESNMQEMVVQIANQIGQEVQYVLDLGLTLEQIQKPTTTHLMDFQKKLSWISGIKITKDGYYLATSQEKNISDAEWDSMSSTAILWDTAIYKPQIEKGLNIDVLISSDVVTESLMSILWEALTIIVVCFIFMTEVLVFLTLKEEQARLTNTIPFTSRAEFIRPVMFICMFSISLCISFIPLHMREISTGFLGLQDNIVMGIPVSCEFFMMGFSTMICGTIIPKIGWRLPLLWGIGILAFSNIMSGLINDPWVFLVARSLAGIGYGMLSLSAQVFVVSHSSSISKGRNFAFMISGIMAGVVCGSAFGGLIADRLGYGMGFIVTGIYLLMTVIVLLLVLKKEPWVPVEAEKQRMSLRDLKDFLLNTRIFTFLLLGIFPCAFVYIGLIRFYIPILIDTAGGSATTIGRINMFYCLVSMYLSPVFARLIDNSRNKVLWVSGAILICAASVAVLLLSDGIWIVMISVFLIGIVQAIRAGARGSYSLEIPAVTRFGSTRAMITFKFMNLIGQALGPITLGLLIALWGEVISFTVLAIVLVLMSLVFLAVNIPKSIKSQE